MPAILQEVPGYVRHVDATQNQVQVKGGSNWDLSRSALETPITLLPDPVPVEAPESSYAPSVVTIPFSTGSSVVTQTGLKTLAGFKASSRLTVTGFADIKEKNPKVLAQKRAAAVAKRIKGASEVSTQVAPLSDMANPANRKVEITSE